MAQFLNTPWISTPIPGAYVNTTVISNASGLATSGVILIMGEAAGGPDYTEVKLANNFYGPTALNQVRSIYTSGPIVDAFAALSAPSNDPDITGTANSIYIIKTNKGSQASSAMGQYTFTVSSANATAGATYANNGQTFTVVTTIASGTSLVMTGTGAPTTSGALTKVTGTGDTTITFSAVSGYTYGTMTALNYGTGGNLFNYTVTSLDAEVAPTVTGVTVPAFGAPLNGDTFSLRLDGGVVDVVTLSSGSSSPVGPTESAAAQTAAHSAYTSLNGMTATPISATLDGQTLTPGVYSTGAAALATSGTGTLTFNGAGVYVIQTSSTLVTGAGGTPVMTLTGGATAANIYWVVGSSATINSGFTGTFQGNVIAETSITDTLGGTVNGSLIALNGAVTLSAATLVNAQNSPLLNYAGSFGLLGASAVTGSAASGTTVTGNVGSSPTNTITNFPPGVIVGAAHSNIAELVTELNILLPSGIVASAGASNNVVLTMAADANANAKGWGKSFELIDSTPGDLAALGLVAGLTVSSQEPAVEVQVVNTTAGVNETFDVAPIIALMVGYEGTTATMTINSTTLTTSVVGGIGANLSVTLSQYTTIAELAAFINSQPGYSASASSGATSLPPSALDQVTAIGIASTADVQPGRVKDSVYAFSQQLVNSTAVGFTPAVVAGLPVAGTLTYLAGGLLGPTLAADIVNCIAQMAGIQLNIIVPLFSQDASKDILAGNTDPGSTYTIDAINELLKSHCIQYSTPTLKRNRTAILSYNDTYANCKAQAQSLASYRCSLTCQQVTQVNSAGVNQLFLPWYGSCVAAGMQAGGFYKSICNHLANIVSYQDPVGYDSGDPADVADALIAGLLVLSQNTSGIPWVSDQTSYGLDSSFVYNSIQAVYLSDILVLDLAQSFQSAIVGKSVADISAASGLSFLQQRFDYYKKLKMVTTSNDAPLGYKNASITISAPTMTVNVEAKPTTSIYFCAINLALSVVQQSAS